MNKRKNEAYDLESEDKALKVKLDIFKRIMSNMHNKIKDLKESQALKLVIHLVVQLLHGGLLFQAPLGSVETR